MKETMIKRIGFACKWINDPEEVNGETRAMPCTLKAEFIPAPAPHISNTDNPVDFPKVKKENPNVMNVWCLDKKEWRSFRIANVISAKVKDETNTVQS